MERKNNELNFSKQKFFIGLDVHKQSWTVTVRGGNLELETYRMNPSAEELSVHMKRKYPNGDYYSVYEAGFCGFNTDRELKEYGIKNIIVNPSDVPTTNKERNRKTDPTDSKKLSRALEKGGEITGIYVPSRYHEQLRSLCRLRHKLTIDQTRIKNRIKSYLMFSGIELPGNDQMQHWSGKFIKYLESIDIGEYAGNECLRQQIEQLRQTRDRIVSIVRTFKKLSVDNGFRPLIDNLITIPGIGFVNAIILYTELIDINRFPRLDELACYVGLSPAEDSSGQEQRILGLSTRKNGFLRNLIIEAAWIAVKNDPSLLQCYGKYIKRMPRQKAIVKIARKLLSRIQHVWKTNTPYVKGVVQ